ncbi:leucine-rich repeat serine/threonine-protein kinase 1-like isoform X1 [Mytilus trossulus]|uniref:leucine-rich repeat serine/threonine-protein kinase 1-like isoform X1 n=1 Tax=Mytilus trossulus TaxID=6551 RepID=UPI0030042AE9
MSDFTGEELIQAAIYNQHDLLTCLLEGECQNFLNKTDRCHRTAIYTSVSNNSFRCLQILLEYGADANIPANEQFNCMTPLHLAILDGKEKITQLLLESGVDVNIKDATGLTPLELANNIDRDDLICMIKSEIIGRKEKMDTVGQDFLEACQEDELATMRSVLNKSQSKDYVNQIVEGGLTPLYMATEKKNAETVEFLLDHEADPRVLADNGYAAIHKACEDGSTDIIKLFQQHCPDVIGIHVPNGKSLLHICAESGQVNSMKTILDFKYPPEIMRMFEDEDCTYNLPLDINAIDMEGQTVLHLACKNGEVEIVRYLVDFTVKPKWKGKMGRTRVSVRKTTPISPSSSQVSLYSPVKINAVNNNGLMPLHIAIKKGSGQITEILLKAKADVSAVVKDKGKETTALMIACQLGDSYIMDKLLQYNATDHDKKVFKYAKHENPQLLSILLKYRTTRDNEFPINKSGMRKEYLEKMSGDQDSFDSVSSININFKKTLPSFAVHIKWQDLEHVSAIEDEDLKYIGYHHNPSMETFNSRFALYAITKIDVSGNNLGILFPDNLLRLPSLHVLDVSRNRISTFGVDVKTECDFLQELRLDHNHIDELPHYIFKFEKLKVLSLGNNYLREISPEVWVMQSLIVLNLADNKIVMLPPPNQGKSCSKPRKLSTLQSLPSVDTGTYIQESEVKHSTVWSTWLNVLETEFDMINKADRQNSGLQDLNLSHNELTDIPSWLACVAPFLENLNLAHNWISGVGMISSFPQHLKTLDLSSNRIQDTTQFQFYSKDYVTCYSSKVSLGSRPSSRGSPTTRSLTSFSHLSGTGCQHQMHTILEQLDTLNLSYNDQLKSVIVTKTGLEDLSLTTEKSFRKNSSTNSMKSLTIAKDEKTKRLLFPNLTSLDLSYNKHLTELPMDLGDLSSLKRLCLSKSSIRELPPQLGRLKNLLTIEIELCPLEGHIQDIISKKANFRTRDILGFLLSVLEDSVEYNCMNLMLVGVEKIGKTTLLSEISRNRRTAKKATHWNERKTMREASSEPYGEFLSTVGIDINELTIGEKRSKGIVVFKTWDFGGQKEYYATHQYFLSPRSLYLVMWKVTSGELGVFGIWQWLVNIQARAPGAPVLIVGTHKDELTARATRDNYPANFEESMKNMIDNLFVKVDEPDKAGLPNVLGMMNINCKDSSDCKKLVDKIYDIVFELKHPRRKHEKLLNHKVPRKYILLKDIIQDLAEERIKCKKDPVLDKDSYVLKTMDKMNNLSQSLFRDADDLDQATRFLHENGILFHYEGIGLKDRYFLDPQWLCDQLAQVVTVDQVNNFCRNGVMKIKNLQNLFNKSAFQPEDLQTYICGLLEKFEVALQFDSNKLLIPSLLPTENEMEHVIKTNMDAKIYLMEKVDKPSPASTVYRGLGESVLSGNQSTTSAHKLGESVSPTGSISYQKVHDSPTSQLILLSTMATNNVTFACARLYIMTYFPSGFWPRLITRMLADPQILPIVLELFPLPQDVSDMCPGMKHRKPFWQPWQTGLQLVHHGTVIFRIKEIQAGKPGLCTYSQHSLKCYLEDQWLPLDMKNSVVLEMCFPSDSITFSFAENMENRPYQTLTSSRKEQIFLEEKATAAFLTKVTENVDNLLQDWYPDIACSRFEQNCFGRYLITRIIPCPYCLQNIVKKEHGKDTRLQWQLVTNDSEVSSSFDLEEETDEDDESFLCISTENPEDTLFCFLVERCILNFQRNHDEICPNHSSVSPMYMLSMEGLARTLHIAPDAVFNDLDRSVVIGQTDTLTMEKKLGRGGFGDVWSGKLRRIEEKPKDVAVKILFEFPSVKPRPDQHQLYLEMAVSAYLTARQEVSILRSIRHDHIVPLLGLSARQPLALVLSLAPKGSLRNELDMRNKINARLSVFTIKQIVIQVADALSYLHSEKIIYRDLKSDNVLIWDMPSADTIDDIMEPVTVKMADYGISRSVMSTGTKGFGGTPPFIAPEILQHGGTSTYTEKVDIFSFGMFLYELITCKNPLEDVTNPSLYICQQGRPHITPKEKQYPSHFLDLMCVSWSHDPENRPTAEQICQISASHQFCHLADAVSLNSSVGILNGCSVVVSDTVEEDDIDDMVPLTTDLWLSTDPSQFTSRIEIFSFDSRLRCTSNKTIKYEPGYPIEALISVSPTHVWCVDKQGSVCVYSTSSYECVWDFRLTPPDTRIQVLGHRKLTFDVKIVVKRDTGKKATDILDVYTISNTIHTSDSKDSLGLLTGSGVEHKELTVNGRCFCAVFHGNSLWLGQSYGKILVIDLETNGEQYLETSNVGIPTIQCQFLEVSSKLDNSVWAYIYPGTVIYKWNAETLMIDGKFDSHVVPNSEASHVSTHVYEARNYQITSMKVIDKYLYMGTTWGCLIVADAENLQVGPYTVFRCHGSEDFRIILPLHDAEEEDSVPGIITIGTGFRDIVKQASGFDTRHTNSDSSDNVFEDESPKRSAMKNHTHILSWYAKNWEYF